MYLVWLADLSIPDSIPRHSLTSLSILLFNIAHVNQQASAPVTLAVIQANQTVFRNLQKPHEATGNSHQAFAAGLHIEPKTML